MLDGKWGLLWCPVGFSIDYFSPARGPLVAFCLSTPQLLLPQADKMCSGIWNFLWQPAGMATLEYAPASGDGASMLGASQGLCWVD